MRQYLPLFALPVIASLAACGSSPPPVQPAGPLSAASAVAAPAPVAVVLPLTLAQTGIKPEWMNPAVDACQDFFGYACGGFVKTAAIPADRSSWGTTEELEKSTEEFLRSVLDDAAKGGSPDPVIKKIGDYYAACMDEGAIAKAGLDAIHDELAIVHSVKSPASLYDALAKIHAIGLAGVFSLSVGQDLKDATQEIAQLDQGGLGLPDRDYYLKDEGNLKSIRDFYVHHVERTLALGGMKAPEAKAATADVMRIETALARISQDKVLRRDPHATYHRVEREGLKKLAKRFTWDRYFDLMGVPSVTAISVNSPEYFTAIDRLMVTEKPSAWRNYLMWHVLAGMSPVLPDPFVLEAFSLTQKIRGIKEISPRWKRCVRSVNADLGELLGQPFVASRFAGDSKTLASTLVAEIHHAMDDELSQLAWMDDSTRGAAKAKLAKVQDKVGYPEKWRSYDFDVTRSSYAADSVAADKFEIHRQLNKIGKPVDRKEWATTAPTVNAYYDASLNDITLPAGQLQPPFFSRAAYAPVNIGDIGANTIGHELTHAFDDEGSQFDGDGNLRDWWSEATKAKFLEAVKCVQGQYSAYEAVPGVHLNGEMTSGENIADIGGVKLGYSALMTWKKAHPEAHREVTGATDERLFFLGYAQGWCTKETNEILEMRTHTDPHSPARHRVNGPVSDVPAFAEAFSCKVGTPMNSGKVCAVW